MKSTPSLTFARQWSKSLLLLAGGAVFLGSAIAQPTNNPVAAHYGAGGYPTWVDELKWDNVIDMSTYANGADNFEKFENARDQLHAAGGGVLYYPAGEYVFDLPDMGYGSGIGPMSRGLMLKSGVVIRGADLAPEANQAVVRATEDAQHPDFANDVSHNLSPATVFVFPTHMRGTDPVTDFPNSAGEVPSHWSFIGLTTGTGETTIADVHNIGVVNVTLEGGTIYWGYHTPRPAQMRQGKWFGDVWKTTPEGAPDSETWSGHTPTGEHYMHSIHGSASWHSEVSAGSGRLVSGVRINNGATWNDMFYADRKAPASTAMGNDTFAHYRFTGRIAAHGSNIFIGNNVIAKPTKNFIHEQIQRRRGANSNTTELVLFDYANHIGIDVNKSNFGGNQEHASVITPGSGYYFENVVVRDNWVFNRGNKNFEVSGQWAVLYNNHAEKFLIHRTFPFDYVTNPEAVAGSSVETGVTMVGVSFDGWSFETQTTPSDYMNRGYDMSGRNVWVGRSTLVNSGSIGNDGEGVMSQEHNRVGNYSWAFTDVMHGRTNKGPGTIGHNGWHGTWNMQQFGLMLLRAWSHGSIGVFGAERPSSPDTGLNWVLDVSIVGGNPGPGGITSISAGDGPNEPVDFNTTDHFDPVAAPSNVTLTQLDNNALRIDWVDVAENELGYRVDRRINGGTWQTLVYRPMSNLLKTITDVQDPLERKGSDSLVAVPTMIAELNPQSWVDFTAPIAQADMIEYRVVAINAADDDSTGVSEVVSLGQSPSFSSGAIDFASYDLGTVVGQDRWTYTADGATRLQPENVAVAEGGLEWMAADGGTIAASAQHLYTQAGVGANGKMDRWMAYTPVAIAGPTYVRFVTVMESRLAGSTIGANDPYELFFGLTNNAAIDGAPWSAYVALKYPSSAEGVGVETTNSGGVLPNGEIALDQAMLVVAHYDVNEAGQLTAIKVWINPDEADAATPDHTITFDAPGVVLAEQDHLKFRMQNMPARIDHLLVADTWAEVVPQATGLVVAPELSLVADAVTAEVGASATLTISVTGTPPYTYQWRKDGQDINGATNASLALDPLTLEDAGSYTVVVSNAAGSVESAPITVTVEQPPAPNLLTPLFTETFDAIASEGQDEEGNPITIYTGVPLASIGWNVHHSFAGVALDGLATGSDAPNDVLTMSASNSVGDFAIGEERGYMAFFTNNYPLYGQGDVDARPALPGPHPVTGEYYHNRTLATFLWKEATITEGDRALIEQFNFVQGNRDAIYHQFFPAVRIGNAWFVYIVSNETLRDEVRILGRPSQSGSFGEEAVFSGSQFSEGGAYANHYNAQPNQFSWSESGWTELVFDGATGSNSTVGMVLGDPLAGELPSGDITAVGVFSPENIDPTGPSSPGYNFNGLRIDSIQILASEPVDPQEYAFTFNNEGQVGGLDRPIQAANWTGIYSSAALPLITSEAVFADLSEGVSSETTIGAYKAGFLFVAGKNAQPAPEAFLVYTDNLNVVNTPQLPQGGDVSVNPQTDWYAEPGSFTNDLGTVTFDQLEAVTLRTSPRNTAIRYHLAMELGGVWYVSQQFVVNELPNTWESHTLSIGALDWYTGIATESSLVTDLAQQATAVAGSALAADALVSAIGLYIDTDDLAGSANAWARVDSISLAIVPPEGFVPPVVMEQPQSVAVLPGAAVSFSVTVEASEFTVSYQWFKDGDMIADATEAQFSIAAVSETDAGSYTVQVSNGAGAILSTAAELTVLPLPQVDPMVIAVAGNGGTATVTVTADLRVSWEASSPVNWITISSGQTGVGDGSVGLSIAPNNSVQPRSATIMVAGAEVTINQAGVQPFIDPFIATTSFAAAGGSGQVEITAAPADAAWELASSVAWISFDGATSGTGSMTVGFTVAPNFLTAARSGDISIGGFNITIEQTAAELFPVLVETGQTGVFVFSDSWLGTGTLIEEGGNRYVSSDLFGWWIIEEVPQGLMAYDSGLETWLYSNAIAYPWVYIYAVGEWHYMETLSSERIFISPDGEGWGYITEQDLVQVLHFP